MIRKFKGHSTFRFFIPKGYPRRKGINDTYSLFFYGGTIPIFSKAIWWSWNNSCLCLFASCLFVCVYVFVSFSELLLFADVHVPFLQVHCPTGPKQVQAGTMGQWKAVFFWMTGGIKIYDGKSPCSWIWFFFDVCLCVSWFCHWDGYTM